MSKEKVKNHSAVWRGWAIFLIAIIIMIGSGSVSFLGVIIALAGLVMVAYGKIQTDKMKQGRER